MTVHLQELQAEDSILQQISSADADSNNDQMHKYMTAELEKYHERVRCFAACHMLPSQYLMKTFHNTQLIK